MKKIDNQREGIGKVGGYRRQRISKTVESTTAVLGRVRGDFKKVHMLEDIQHLTWTTLEA
jgi:hypothetical protein